MTPDRVTVIIPTLGEESSIANCIESARAAGASEIIVSDGGSSDRTCDVATESGATKLVRSLPGRGIQMNAGAQFASGEFLLFLHADNRLTSECLRQIGEVPNLTWGAFRQRIDSNRSIYRVLEFGNAKRVALLKMPFGDQGIYVRRSTFLSAGGYEEAPLMEDVNLSKRLRQIDRPSLLPGPIIVSPRRWERSGVVRQTIRNWKIQAAHAIGVSPERLAKWYR